MTSVLDELNLLQTLKPFIATVEWLSSKLLFFNNYGSSLTPHSQTVHKTSFKETSLALIIEQFHISLVCLENSKSLRMFQVNQEHFNFNCMIILAIQKNVMI